MEEEKKKMEGEKRKTEEEKRKMEEEKKKMEGEKRKESPDWRYVIIWKPGPGTYRIIENKKGNDPEALWKKQLEISKKAVMYISKDDGKKWDVLHEGTPASSIAKIKRVENEYLPRSHMITILEQKTDTTWKDLNPEQTIYWLNIEIINARNLQKVEFYKKPNPLVEVKVGNLSQKTKTIKNSLNPEWNEQFSFVVQQVPHMLAFIIWNWNKDGGYELLDKWNLVTSSIWEKGSTTNVIPAMHQENKKGTLNIKTKGHFFQPIKKIFLLNNTLNGKDQEISESKASLLGKKTKLKEITQQLITSEAENKKTLDELKKKENKIKKLVEEKENIKQRRSEWSRLKDQITQLQKSYNECTKMNKTIQQNQKSEDQKFSRHESFVSMSGDLLGSETYSNKVSNRIWSITTYLVPVKPITYEMASMILRAKHQKPDEFLLLQNKAGFSAQNTSNLTINRIVGEINKIPFGHKTNTSSSKKLGFDGWIFLLVCCLFPFHCLPIWCIMSVNLVISCIQIPWSSTSSSSIFEELFQTGTKNKKMVAIKFILGSVFIWLPVVIIDSMNSSLDGKKAFSRLIWILIILFIFIVCSLIRYSKEKMFTHLIHRPKVVKNKGCKLSSLGNGIQILVLVMNLGQLSTFSAPADVYPPGTKLGDMYNYAFLDFRFLDPILNLPVGYFKFCLAIIFSYVWFALANYLVVMDIFNRGKDVLKIPGLDKIVAIFSNALFLMITKNLFSYIDCTYHDNGNPTLDNYSNLCWTSSHKILSTLATILVVFYIVSCVVISPFVTEDMSGKTELLFPPFYLMVERMLNLTIALTGIFFSNSHRLHLIISIITSIIDIGCICKWSCTIFWVNVLKTGFRIMIVWSALVSLVALEVSAKKNISFVILMVGNALILVTIGIILIFNNRLMCCKQFLKKKEYLMHSQEKYMDLGTEITKKHSTLILEIVGQLNWDEMYQGEKGIVYDFAHYCVKCLPDRVRIGKVAIQVEDYRSGKSNSVKISEMNCEDNAAKILSLLLVVDSNITKLDLSKNKIGADGASALAKAIAVNSTLKHLDIRSNASIKGKGAKDLANCITKSQTIETFCEIPVSDMKNNMNNSKTNTIKLKGTGCSDAEAMVLGYLLKNYSILEDLDLSNNKIGKDGAIDLAEGLKSNLSLTKLNVSNFSVGGKDTPDDGKDIPEIHFIIEALKHNSSVKSLIMKECRCGDLNDGAIISDLLQINQTLTELNLFDNFISDKGGQLIASALSRLPKSEIRLKYLNLKGNRGISKKTLEKLGEFEFGFEI